MCINNKVVFVLFTILVSIFSNVTFAEVNFSSYELIKKEKSGRSDYNYTYKATITNSGGSLQNVTAQLQSSSQHIVVSEGELIFGDVSTGESLVSIDTFTVKINRRYGFDESALTWVFSADEVVDQTGGEIEGDDGVSAIFPPGATAEPVQVTVAPVEEQALEKPTPPGYSFVGAASFDIGDITLEDNADIAIPKPAGVPDGSEIYVAKMIEYGGNKVYWVVDTAIVDGERVISQDPAFPGIIDSGTYSFLLAQDVNWINGRVTKDGEGVAGAVVSLSGGYFVDIADENGNYQLPSWAGNFVVVAFDPITADFGQKQDFLSGTSNAKTVNVSIGSNSSVVNDTIINGGFEDSSSVLAGWELEGAGGVITSFGNISPHSGSRMAMITSGTGAIGGTSSALQQSFIVPENATTLTLKYNFVSDEYPEYVGTQFNDVFSATLITPNGSNEIAFESVNTATFQSVSGLSGTWGQTGWIEKSIDVSQWAGTSDTLTITVHDVGDSSVDSMVLVDDVAFNNDSTATKAVLLLHGMNSNPATWNLYVKDESGFNGYCRNIYQGAQISEIVDKLIPVLIPDSEGVYCYRIEFGGYDISSGLTGINDPGHEHTPKLNGDTSGDYSSYTDLGKEVKEAVQSIRSTYDNNTEIALVGHSRGGLAARAFLQDPQSTYEKNSISALLTTGTPHKGSRFGRVYQYLEDNTRADCSEGFFERCEDDWEVVDQLIVHGTDVRVPTIGFLSDKSPDLLMLNAKISDLPNNVVYGNIVYTGLPLGFVARHDTYGDINVFDIPGQQFNQKLTDNAEIAILDFKIMFDDQTKKPSVYSGDGIVEAVSQDMRSISGFLPKSSDYFPTPYNENILHVDETKEITHIQNGLSTMLNWWN